MFSVLYILILATLYYIGYSEIKLQKKVRFIYYFCEYYLHVVNQRTEAGRMRGSRPPAH